MCVLRRGCFLTYGWNGLCCQRGTRLFSGMEELSFSALLRLLILRTGPLDICWTNTAGVEKWRWCNIKRFHASLFHFLLTFIFLSFNQNKDNNYLNNSFAVQGIKISGNHKMSATFCDKCFEQYLKTCQNLEGYISKKCLLYLLFTWKL